VAVVAASVEILRLAGKSADGMLLLNGNDKETMIAIYKLKNNASRARSSAAVKAVSVTDLSGF
jgi:DNA polymerase II small subunit/DNA polymerase delta subunit B